jgi:hypothetical protein
VASFATAQAPRLALERKGFEIRHDFVLPIVEWFFNKLKHFRAIATRYDKRDDNFLASIQLASIRIWLRTYESVTSSTNTAMAASAVARSGALRTSRRSALMLGCTDFGALLRMLTSLCCQHRW